MFGLEVPWFDKNSIVTSANIMRQGHKYKESGSERGWVNTLERSARNL